MPKGRTLRKQKFVNNKYYCIFVASNDKHRAMMQTKIFVRFSLSVGLPPMVAIKAHFFLHYARSNSVSSLHDH